MKRFRALQVRHMQAKRKKFFKLSLTVCLTQILVLFGVERPLENKVSVPIAKYKVHALSIMAPSVTKIVSSALVDVSQWMLILPAFGKFLGRFGVPNERHYAEECIFRVLQCEHWWSCGSAKPLKTWRKSIGYIKQESQEYKNLGEVNKHWNGLVNQKGLPL